MRTHRGAPASVGYAVGPVHLLRKTRPEVVRRAVPPDGIAGENERFRRAVERARGEIEELTRKVSREIGLPDSEILASQLLILEDELIWDRTRELIAAEGINAEAAFSRAIADIALRMDGERSGYLRDRIADLRDVEDRVLMALAGTSAGGPARPEVPSVIVAHDLSPSDTAALGRENVLGFLLGGGGQTSHVTILARSIGAPAVIGLGGAVGGLRQGQLVAVDGYTGEVVVEPDAATRQRFRELGAQQASRERRLEVLRDLPAVSTDGRRLRLMANIELPQEVEQAVARGAEGIGLLRTEFFYFQRRELPDEDEQTAVYADILRRLGGRPVVFRSLDVGGDKISDWLGAKREYNPFLGWRGIRFTLANRALFKTQIRAIYRAAVAGPAKLMFPMVTGVEELRAAREICREAALELEREGRPHDAAIEIGIMLETPAAAMIADLLAAECDFFSIGTNDLIQYTLAMDRGNSRVAHLYQPAHPAVLRTLRAVVEAGHAAGIWVGLCGEMGSETRFAEVMLGLGLDEISLHGGAIPKVKQVVRWTALAEARDLVRELTSLSTAAEADAHLARYIERKKAARQAEGAGL